MARYLDVHPDDPQPRLVAQTVALIRDGGVAAYPTDSGYALGCGMDRIDARERMLAIRRLDGTHEFSLLCADFAQMGQLVHLSNAVFRAVKAATPGPYTFVLPGSDELPRRMLHPKKKTVGVRISADPLIQALLRALGEPLVSTTLILPDETEPLTDGWDVKERLDHQVDAVLDTGRCGSRPTTVIDLSTGEAEIIRYGAGDPAPFEAA